MSTPEGLDPIHDAARVRVGTAVRRLAHAVVGRDADTDELNDAAAEIERMAEELESRPRRIRDLSHFGKTLADEPADGDRLTSHIARPGSGEGSPFGFPMTVHREGNRAVARFAMDSAHEGPPQRAHGGIVALAFDDALGFVLNMHQVIAYTAKLSITYRAGTPLGTPLVITAWMDRRDGRKCFIESELREDRPDAPLIATCSALFIQVERHPGASDTLTSAVS